MKQHIRNVHEKKNTFNCDDCGKSFSKFNDLNIHINLIHNDQAELHEYEIDTNKSLAEASNLKMHTKAMNKIHKDFKCKTCGQSFSRSYILKIHIHTVHNVHKNYKCKSCGK